MIVVILVAVAVFAPQLAPHGPKDTGFAPYLPPSAEFPMGTDQIGRDVLSRVVWGARLSLYVGLTSVLIGVTLGALWGAVTGYIGGGPDAGSQRVVDSLMALPRSLALRSLPPCTSSQRLPRPVAFAGPTAAEPSARSLSVGIPFGRPLGRRLSRSRLGSHLPTACQSSCAPTNRFALVVEARSASAGRRAPDAVVGGMLTP